MRRQGGAALALCLAVAMALAACAQDAGRTPPSTQSGVSDVMQEQMQQNQSAPDEPATTQGGAFVGDEAPAFDQVDYDLTTMSSDMVYATVFDMVTDPATYEGKIVKMAGPFSHSFYEPTQMNYFYVIIQDATACCSQGLEFVWGDGSHAYPEQYPQDGTEVVVTGRFETYTEGSQGYIHLADAG